MDFTQVVNDFLAANPRISRDERNLKMLVDYVLSQKLTITLESAPILLDAFVREHSHEILWLAEEKPSQDRSAMWARQNKGYNLYEENRKAAEQRAKQRESVKRNAELTGQRAAFEAEMRRIVSWKEFRGAHINWSQTFSVQREKYSALAKAHPMWASECEAASARVGK